MNSIFISGFGSRLKEERERLGFNQTKFAESAGVKRATQYLYEVEENSPNYRYFKAIAELDVDIPFLFYGKRSDSEALEYRLDVLQDIFRAVEEYGRNEKGDPLPSEIRLDFFSMLCASYSGRNNFDMKPEVVQKLFSK